MRRIFALAALVALTLGMLAHAGQCAIGHTGRCASGQLWRSLNTNVPYIGSDGAQIGTITVNKVTDPFDGFDTSSAPQRGYHFAVAEVTVSNTSNRPFEVNPSAFMAIDSDGFVAQQPYIGFTDATMTALEYTDALAPGDSVTGVIPYALFGNSTIERIVFSPTYDRVITVLDVRTAPVAIGSKVSIMGTTGTETAQVTVGGVQAPFDGYDASSAPPRGSTRAVEVTVTNTGTAVLSVSPSDIWVIDADGFVLSSSYVTRTDTTVPDYDYLDLNPGESQHGILVFQIYEGIPVATIAYGDGYTSMNVVADVDASSMTPATSPSAGATIAAPPVAATEAPALPTTAALTDSSPDCAGLVAWGNDLVDRITKAAALTAPLQTQDASTLNAASVKEIGAQLRAFGDAQAASNPPAAAANLNTLMSEQFYYALANAVDQIATALENNNAAAALAGQMTAQQVSKLFDAGGPYDLATKALAAACPNEVQQLDAQTGN